MARELDETAKAKKARDALVTVRDEARVAGKWGTVRTIDDFLQVAKNESFVTLYNVFTKEDS